MADQVEFTTPVGRLVMGSLYKPQTQDADGNPLLIKTGPNAGQPRVDYFFALAIPKGTEQHWASTAWGAKIWETGHKGFPRGQANAPTFAWKVTDGDSAIPNRKGNKPADREGFPGHWVLNFSGGYAPRLFNSNGTQALTEPDAVKLGYWAQVNGSVSGNGSDQQPGVYLNHRMVALSGYGAEIMVGPDPTSAGFGQAPLPAGVSVTPVGGLAAGAPPPPPAHALPAASYAPPVAAIAPPGVAPNPAFLAGPAAGVAPPPPLVAAAPARVMLPAAQGATYEQLIAAGWNDVLLVQHGYMKA